MFESAAIVHRLAQRTPALMPDDPAERDLALTWMFAALNTVEPPINELFRIDFVYDGEPWAKLRRPGAVEEVRRRLEDLARWLDGRDHLLGRFTCADILMVTSLWFLRHTPVIAEASGLAAYAARCEARPAFRLALESQLEDFRRHEPAS